jgi:hypothetical protein
MRIPVRDCLAAIALAVVGMGATLPVHAQAPGGGRGGPPEYWWVNKTQGGVYKPPMRPLWKLSDLKRMHAGQNNWTVQIILDPRRITPPRRAVISGRGCIPIHPRSSS